MTPESSKKPWVKMPADEAKELCLLRARVLELAAKHLIDTRLLPSVEILEQVIQEERKDAWLEGFTRYTPEEDD